MSIFGGIVIGNLDELRYEGGYPARAGRLCCASTGRATKTLVPTADSDVIYAF